MKSYIVSTTLIVFVLVLCIFKVNGTASWVKQIGGALGSEVPNGIAIDDVRGVVYVTGYYQQSCAFNGSTTLISKGMKDMYVASYQMSSGELRWVATIGGTQDDIGVSVTVDSISGSVYVVGTVQNVTGFNYHGDSDVFVVKYSQQGEMLWIRTAGSISKDEATGVAIGSDGNVFVTGSFSETIVFDETNTLLSAGMSDIFIAKYSSSGTFIKAWRYGGTGDGK
jgi:hypothetical protein